MNIEETSRLIEKPTTFREGLAELEEYLLRYAEGKSELRDPRIEETEERLVGKLRPWAKVHNGRDPKKFGERAYSPNNIDQRIDVPYVPINGLARSIVAAKQKPGKPAASLRELAYLKASKRLYLNSIGTELGEIIIDKFLTTQALDDEDSPSIAEYIADVYRGDEHRTTGLSSIHLPSLSDIGELAVGLQLSIAELYGMEFYDRADLLVAKSKTLQTRKLDPLGIIQIPLTPMIRIALGTFTGSPSGESAESYGISQEDTDELNARMAQSFAERRRRLSTLFAYVQTSSEAAKTYKPGSSIEVESVVLRSAGDTDTLTVRMSGGIIPANIFAGKVAIGQIIDTTKPEGMRKPEWQDQLSNRLMEVQARQAVELTSGAIVTFKNSKGQDVVAQRKGDQVTVEVIEVDESHQAA